MSQMSPPPESDIPNTSEFRMDSDRLSQISLWSMILGILFLCLGPLGLVPLVMGIVGIVKTSGGKMRGMGFAIAGTALGSVAVLGSCLSVGILLPAFGKARQTAMMLKSQTQLRSIGQGMTIYATNNNDQFPPVDLTFDILLDQGLIESELLVSPLEDGDGVSYILVGVEELSFNATEIIAYEDPKHWDAGVSVLFADMRVEMVPHLDFQAMLAEQEAQMSNQP